MADQSADASAYRTTAYPVTTENGARQAEETSYRHLAAQKNAKFKNPMVSGLGGRETVFSYLTFGCVCSTSLLGGVFD